MKESTESVMIYIDEPIIYIRKERFEYLTHST